MKPLYKLFLILLAAASTNFAQTDAAEFEAMLNKLDTSIEKFVNGDAAEFRSFWLHDDGVTIAGGFGGEIEKGWEPIDKRLSRVGQAYNKTLFETERISFGTSGELGYLVQHEYFTIFGSDGEIENRRAYRVTMLFKYVSDEWKLIHRHANPSITWKGME